MTFDIMCPHCHRLFTVEREEKEAIREEVVQNPDDELGELLVGSYKGGVIFGPSGSARSHGVIIIYKSRFKCKNCGHEWAEIQRENLGRQASP
jgi:transposase-like protein